MNAEIQAGLAERGDMGNPMPSGMPAGEVLAVLKKQGVDAFYHANTVRTSIAFLEEWGLLSREKGEAKGQTAQYTDDKDKQYGIWDKVFIDTLDIHACCNKHNQYGPVLFVFDLEILNSNLVEEIRVSAKNPFYWQAGDNIEDHWFVDVKDLASRFNQNRASSKSIVITCKNGILPFRQYLRKIILDCSIGSGQPKDYALLRNAKAKLIVKLGPLKDLLERRNCNPYCKCHDYYKNENRLQTDEFKKFFAP